MRDQGRREPTGNLGDVSPATFPLDLSQADPQEQKAKPSIHETPDVFPNGARTYSLKLRVSRAMDDPSATLPQLAAVLRASPESDALVILGRLLDSLPIGFYVTERVPPFRITYCNRVAASWVEPEAAPLTGKPVGQVFKTLKPKALDDAMRVACRTRKPQRIRGVEFSALQRPVSTSGHGTWEWEIYPLGDSHKQVTHLLNVVMNVTSPEDQPTPGAAQKLERNRMREEASGVLRIFGVAPDGGEPRLREQLSGREWEIAELIAQGLTNSTIASRLRIRRSTVASHVVHILAKLGVHSRAQVVAWVIERRLRLNWTAGQSQITEGEG